MAPFLDLLLSFFSFSWNWLLNLNLIYKTLQTGVGSGFLISMLEKQLLSFDQSNNTSASDVKMGGSVLDGKSFFKMLGLTFFSNLDWGSLSLKLPTRKLVLWFVLWSFVLLRIHCISINLPYSHAWNTVVMSRLVCLIATWKC